MSNHQPPRTLLIRRRARPSTDPPSVMHLRCPDGRRVPVGFHYLGGVHSELDGYLVLVPRGTRLPDKGAVVRAGGTDLAVDLYPAGNAPERATFAAPENATTPTPILPDDTVIGGHTHQEDCS